MGYSQTINGLPHPCLAFSARQDGIKIPVRTSHIPTLCQQRAKGWGNRETGWDRDSGAQVTYSHPVAKNATRVGQPRFAVFIADRPFPYWNRWLPHPCRSRFLERQGGSTISPMPPKPVRYQNQRCLHFITFSCYQRMPLLDSIEARETFEHELERVRRWYGLYIAAYVVMPEHVHLLITEPERGELSVAIQMLKQITSHKLKPPELARFWQVRYYSFPVWSAKKRIEKLRYIYRNPVRRELVRKPEDWKWSSFAHYATGVEGIVEIESQWTVRKRERMGIQPTLMNSHPVAKNATRVGQPRH